jgi:RNA polymerase sigma-70 factor (ECF subfamily)
MLAGTRVYLNLFGDPIAPPGVPGVMDDLVERAREGSAAAFEALVRRHDRRRMLSLASRLTGRLEDAQEVAQESFSRLYKNLKRIRSDDEVGPWLRVVTVSRCRDLARRRRGRR